MPNDAIILSLEKLTFTWSIAKTLDAYLVGVATDNFGGVQVIQPPSSTHVIHRPGRDRPFSWPLAFDGFTLYQRTGGLPDFVMFSLLIVHDRQTARRAGAVLQSLSKSDDFKELMSKASSISSAAGKAAGTAASAIGDITKPLLGLIGSQIENSQDKLLDTIDGSMHFDPVSRAKNELSSTVNGGIANATFDFHLFDAATDAESKTSVDVSLADLRSRGLLIGSTPTSSSSTATTTTATTATTTTTPST